MSTITERNVLKAAEAYVQAIEPDGAKADADLTAAVEALWAERAEEEEAERHITLHGTVGVVATFVFNGLDDDGEADFTFKRVQVTDDTSWRIDAEQVAWDNGHHEKEDVQRFYDTVIPSDDDLTRLYNALPADADIERLIVKEAQR